jgi:hypothetical protein
MYYNSNEWTEWHLTPRGWVRGSTRRDPKVIDDVEPPSDRALTKRYCEYGVSSVEATQEELWRSPDAALVAGLLSQHGEAPRHL